MTSADLPPADPACRERSEGSDAQPFLLWAARDCQWWDRGGFSDYKKVSPLVIFTPSVGFLRTDMIWCKAQGLAPYTPPSHTHPEKTKKVSGFSNLKYKRFPTPTPILGTLAAENNGRF